MKQHTQNYKTGDLRLDEVLVPAIQVGGILLRNACSLISAGTEKMKLELAEKGSIGKTKDRASTYNSLASMNSFHKIARKRQC